MRKQACAWSSSEPCLGSEAIPIRVRAVYRSWSATWSDCFEPPESQAPYILVGTSGGGFITAGYAVAHPRQVAGMVFIDTGAPFRDPPSEIVEATDPNNPANVEHRDYLQVEKDAWAARKRIGDIPVTIVSVKYSDAAINGVDPSGVVSSGRWG